MAYVFQADLLCDDCGGNLCKELNLPEDVLDSDAYPQQCANGGGEADSPVHCGSCRAYLKAPLTEDGVDYAVEHIRNYCLKRIAGERVYGDRAVFRVWAEDLRQNYGLDACDKAVVSLFLEAVKRDDAVFV